MGQHSAAQSAAQSKVFSCGVASLTLTKGQPDFKHETQTPMPDRNRPLKLIALDVEDLTVLSAAVQDAILDESEISFDASKGQLILPLRRYAWELPGARRWLFPTKQRRLSVLDFARVLKVEHKGMSKDKSGPLAILALKFEQTGGDDDPSGVMDIVFAGAGMLRAHVECVEARLVDQGATWRAAAKPRHGDG